MLPEKTGLPETVPVPVVTLALPLVTELLKVNDQCMAAASATALNAKGTAEWQIDIKCSSTGVHLPRDGAGERQRGRAARDGKDSYAGGELTIRIGEGDILGAACGGSGIEIKCHVGRVGIGNAIDGNASAHAGADVGERKCWGSKIRSRIKKA